MNSLECAHKFGGKRGSNSQWGTYPKLLMILSGLPQVPQRVRSKPLSLSPSVPGRLLPSPPSTALQSKSPSSSLSSQEHDGKPSSYSSNPFNMPGKARAFDTWARDQRLLDATIKHMDSKSCAALYKVNMAFRQSLAPSKWESVRFQDTEAQLVEQLSNLLSYPPESRKYLHHHIKNASIIILAHGPADGAVQRWKRVSDFPLLPPEVDGLPKLILDAITSMPQLQSLTIDVWAFRDKQVNEFTRLLAENWRWKWKLNHLNILAHDDIIRDIINHCDSDELRGLHLYTGTGSVAWKAAKKHVRLERLRLHLDRVVETETPTRSMNARILHEIAFLFPGIRWLTLCEVERNYAKCNQLRTREHKAEFANQKDALAKALARFVHLERFAFTLPKSRIANRFICSGLGVAEDKSPREYEWDQFYAGVIKDITKSAPRVREVCVFKEFPYLYRATRTRDGGAFTLRRERRVQPVRNSGFPYGLLGASLRTRRVAPIDGDCIVL
ncbi:hypothetical protein ACJZ2D_008581 [Fusarium nematophilum]